MQPFPFGPGWHRPTIRNAEDSRARANAATKTMGNDKLITEPDTTFLFRRQNWPFGPFVPEQPLSKKGRTLFQGCNGV